MRALLLVLLAVGCPTDPDDVATTALQLQPDSVEGCLDSSFREVADLCLVKLVQSVATTGDMVAVARVCDAISQDLWRDECRFLGAEHLGLGGHREGALTQCGAAGRFADSCFVHAAWWARPFSGRGDISRYTWVNGRLDSARAALKDTTPELRENGLTRLRAALWFEATYGTGEAASEDLAQVPLDHRQDARTAFAWEAVRLALHGGMDNARDIVATVASVWRGQTPTLEGPALDQSDWQGRFFGPLYVRGWESAETFHGGRRLVGADAAEDLLIATLEALAFHVEIESGDLEPWLDDASIRVRAASARLVVAIGVGREHPQVAPDELDGTTDRRVREAIVHGRRHPAELWSPDELEER